MGAKTLNTLPTMPLFMPLIPKQLTMLAKSSLNIRKSAQKKSPAGTRLSKRHWFLSGTIIVSCSWITHSTTANIAQTPLNEIATTNAVLASTSPATTGQSKLALLTLEKQSNLVPANNIGEPKIEPFFAPITEIPSVKLHTKQHKITKGESLGIIFRKHGLNLAIPHHVSKHPIAKKLTSIRAGKTIDFKFDDDSETSLREISYSLNSLQRLDVTLNGTSVSDAAIIDLSYETKQQAVSAEITSSLYLAAQAAGLSNNLIMEMVRIFGWDIDFVQDIRKGDSFHVVFNEYFIQGQKVDDGNILAAEFTTQGQTYRAIRFEDQDGVASYFNPQGDSMLGTFLRSPVEFSRISSRFGKRKHPISKKWKAHKGVDYAASRGTPIRATADGKVIHAGRKGGYGKTVVIRHAGRFSTLYAHMNGYAKGIKSGTRVKQGQTIGYVGSTGMSTGPHLHYEFRVDGVHRNSLTYKTPKASSISKANFQQFTAVAKQLGSTLNSVKQQYELAKKSPEGRGATL